MATRSKLECPSCGAPLLWKGEAPVVECHYCGTHVHTPSGAVTQEPAVVRSQPKGTGGGGCSILALVVGINLLVGGIVAVSTMLAEGPSRVTGVPMERLVALDIAADNATVASALGLAPDPEGEDLNVPLRGSGFDYAYLRWEDDHPDHVLYFGLYASDGHPEPAALLASLEAMLGRRLEPARDNYRNWSWAGTNLNVALDGSHLGVHVDPEGDAHWSYRSKLLWSVLMAAAQGQAIDLQEQTRVAWLAQGYPLSRLADLDLRYDVDGARAYVPATFPGSHEEILIDLDFEVPLSHPWFGQIELSWANEKGGQLEGATLWPVPGSQKLTSQDAVARCLDASLGPGERRIQDHLAGTWSGTWELKDGTWVSLPDHALYIHLDARGRKAADRTASWRKIIGALDRCGR